MSKQRQSETITADEIQKAKDYTDAMDKLRTAINGVNGTLPKFSDGLQAGLKAVGEKLPDVVDAMVKLNTQNKELAANGQKPVSVLSQLASSMFSWNTVVSVGITLLSTYGGAVISWIGDMIKGKTTLSAFAQAMKDNGIITEALIQTKLKGAQAAQGELTALNSVYKATQNHTLGLQKNREAAVLLKEQWPGVFSNMTTETILAGKAAGAYGNLKDQIMATCRAEAAKNKITDNASRILGNEQKIANERANNLKILREQKALEKTANAALETPDENGVAASFYAIKLNDMQERRAASDKILYDLNTDSQLLDKQNDKIGDYIQSLVNSNGTAVLSGGKTLKPAVSNVKSTPAAVTKPDKTDEIGSASADVFNDYNKQIEAANKFYTDLKAKQQLSATETEALEKEHQDVLLGIKDKFQNQDKQKLEQYEHELAQIAIDNTEDAKQKALLELDEQKRQKFQQLDDEQRELNLKITEEQQKLISFKKTGSQAEIDLLTDSIGKQQAILQKAGEIRLVIEAGITKKEEAIKAGNAPDDTTQEDKLKQGIQNSQDNGHAAAALKQQQQLLELQYQAAKNAAEKEGKTTTDIEQQYTQKKIELENKLTASKIHASDKFIDAVLKNSKKDAAIYKAAFLAKKATSIADVIISTKKGIIGSFEGYSSMPFIGQALAIAQAAIIAGEGAASIAEISKQKPGFAKGGQYVSDGRGALLSGYSKNDNTNAYLRSGEAVIVSEAMRNPWARNLVSAINVAHGGRDFSISNPGRGYALGGVFTDGGNASRYYSQPMNDVKDLANTIAYQMINNFPPVYVDVKDINNQQNILAQTVNRVNL